MKTKELANTIYNMMFEYANSRISSEEAKRKKAEKELAETGKTKVAYDESVFNTEFLWSLDVLKSDTKTENMEDVKKSMELLVSETQVERWIYNGRCMGCFYLKLIK